MTNLLSLTFFDAAREEEFVSIEIHMKKLLRKKLLLAE